MTYEYECPNHGKIDIHKSHEHMDKEERCEICMIVMKRNFVPTRNLNPGASSMRGEYQPIVGRVVHSRRELRNEIAKIEGETGKKIIEVGSDKLDTIKKPRKTFDEGEAVRHLAHELKHGPSNH
jgi:hypothetical protein